MEVLVELERELEALVGLPRWALLGEAGEAGAALEPYAMSKVNGWRPPPTEAHAMGHVEALRGYHARRTRTREELLRELMLEPEAQADHRGSPPSADPAMPEHRPVAEFAVAAGLRGLHRGGGHGPLQPNSDFSEARSILDMANTVPDAIVEAPRWKATGEPRLPGSSESVVRGEKRARKQKERGPLIVVRKQPLPPAVDFEDDGGPSAASGGPGDMEPQEHGQLLRLDRVVCSAPAQGVRSFGRAERE